MIGLVMEYKGDHDSFGFKTATIVVVAVISILGVIKTEQVGTKHKNERLSNASDICASKKIYILIYLEKPLHLNE